MAQDKSGKALEKAVARIQQMFDVGSVVTHNETIVDRLGNPRQFDVVIRGKAAGQDYLGVIECKDWGEKVGTPEVEAFVMKARNVNANIVMMVSRLGFSEPALKMATHEGVGTLSLLPDDPAGGSVGVMVYAKLYYWSALQLNVNYDVEDGVPPLGTFELDEILFRGKPVRRWFERQLDTTYGNITEEGDHPITLTFRTPQVIEIHGTPRTINSITVTAKRTAQGKRWWLRLQGDGFFDWQKMKGMIPPGANIFSEPLFPCGIAEWDNFDGDIDAILEERKQYFTLCLSAVTEQFEHDPEMPDLAEL